jgi:hypothetical protein
MQAKRNTPQYLRASSNDGERAANILYICVRQKALKKIKSTKIKKQPAYTN